MPAVAGGLITEHRWAMWVPRPGGQYLQILMTDHMLAVARLSLDTMAAEFFSSHLDEPILTIQERVEPGSFKMTGVEVMILCRN